MDAIVLVGGLGTRLRPLTNTRHKSLVPVCNRPAIEYLFDWLRAASFDRCILALGQGNDDLAAAYPSRDFRGLAIVAVKEEERLESGGGIRNAVAAAGIAGRFVVLNGDVFVDFDFAAMLANHEAKRALLSIALYPVDDPSSFGIAAVDGSGFITRFVEKPPRGTEPSNLNNAGVWIFEPEALNRFPSGAVRVEDTLFPDAVSAHERVAGYSIEGIWADIGTPQRYLDLNAALIAQRGESAIATPSHISPAAIITGSSVGARSRIDARATVRDSILWENVWVGVGAAISGSAIADGVLIGDGAVIDGAVIGAGATISAGSRLLPGTRIDNGQTV